MAKNCTAVEISDNDFVLVEEIRLSEDLTKKEVLHQAINRFYEKWRCS